MCIQHCRCIQMAISVISNIENSFIPKLNIKFADLCNRFADLSLSLLSLSFFSEFLTTHLVAHMVNKKTPYSLQFSSDLIMLRLFFFFKGKQIFFPRMRLTFLYSQPRMTKGNPFNMLLRSSIHYTHKYIRKHANYN